MIEFTVKTSSDVEKLLGKVEKRMGEISPMLTMAGMVMLRSIDENFRSEGRPTKWAPLRPLTKFLRSGESNFKILQDIGRLKGSISAKVYAQSTRAEVVIGTNLDYAPLMHFGGMSKPNTVQKGGRTLRIGSHQVPARPFILFQDADLVAIEKLGLKHVEDATK